MNIYIYFFQQICLKNSSFRWDTGDLSNYDLFISLLSQVANLNGKLTATQTTLTTRDQELREKENEVRSLCRIR